MMHEQHSDRGWLQAHVAHCRRELAETRKAGNDPMGEMSWAGLVEKWQDKLDKLPAMPAAAPESPVGGDFGVGRSSVHAGASEGARRSAEAIQAEIGSGNVFADLGFANPEAEAAKADARIAAGELPKVRELDLEAFLAMAAQWWLDHIAETDRLLASAAERVASTYAAAQRVMADAGPMPLASLEPWEEDDFDYQARLIAVDPLSDVVPFGMLDAHGRDLGLPRARLVPAEPRP